MSRPRDVPGDVSVNRSHRLVAAAAVGLAIVTCKGGPVDPGPTDPPVPPECTGSATVTALAAQTGQGLGGVLMQADDCGWRQTSLGTVTLLRREGPTFRLVAAVTNGFNLDISEWHYWPGRRVLVDELRGLTGSAVTLRFELRQPISFGNVEGSISGGGGGPVRLYGVGAGTGLVQPRWANGDGTYQFYPSWESYQRTLPIVLHAIEERDGGSPRYVAHGERAVTVQGFAGMVLPPLYPDASVALEPVSEAAVTGGAAVPPELADAAVTVHQWLAAPNGGLVLSDLPVVTGAPAVPVDLPFPLVAGLTPWASVRAEGNAGRSWHARALSPPASGVAFDLPSPVTPDWAGVISSQTIFRWSGGPDGGRAALRLECSWMEPIPNFSDQVAVTYIGLIESDGAEITLPPLADGGVGIPHGASCEWRVAWQPDGVHLGAPAVNALEDRGSESPIQSAIFQ